MTTQSLRERADEYVLGLLDPADQVALEAAIDSDRDLRAAVAESRDRFLEIDLAGTPRAVSPDLWQRIDAALPPRNAARPAPPPTPANDNRMQRWRRTALAGMAASLLLLLGLGYSLLTRPEPMVIAVLMNEAGEPLVLIEDFGNRTARVTPLVDFNVPPDRALEVWTLPSAEMGPKSLGLLDGWRSMTLTSQALPQPSEAQLYEITLEQPGGSPTGRPTGPILVKGFAKIPR